MTIQTAAPELATPIAAGLAGEDSEEHTGGNTGWYPICRFEQLIPERGVAALIGDVQVALFRTYDDRVFAIGNIDPFTGSAVLSRGIVGSRGELSTVASPLHKQVFALESGRCLDDPEVSVPRYRTRVVHGMVEARLR